MSGAVLYSEEKMLLDKPVLETIRYYGLFDYPVTAEEILSSLPVKSNTESIKRELVKMEEKAMIFEHKGYYSASPGVRMLVLKREHANRLAESKIAEAIYAGKRLSYFPFVRFVSISGSLSKGYADRKSDFDFFIVTAVNRLWICRTILHLYKKLTFITGRQDRYCMNYFIDESRLEIEDKNRYTSIELASIIPVYGVEIKNKLRESNLWVKNFLPNEYKNFFNLNSKLIDGNSPVKNIAEKILNLFFPVKLNAWLMRFTDRRWRKKWERNNYPMKEYNTAFRTSLTVSKNHPANFQKKILDAIAGF
jgi:hypothetical protein